MKKITFLLMACFVAMAAHAQIYVKPASDGGDDALDGKTWATAKATVQAAITAAPADDRIVWVKTGVYSETFWSRAIQGNNGVKIYGGFKGDETSIEARAKGSKKWDFTNPSEFTFTDAAGAGINMSGNAALGKEVVIDGFTFKNAASTIAAIRAFGIIQSCIVKDNNLVGKAVLSTYHAGGEASILDCYVVNNTSTNNNVFDLSTSAATGSVLVDGCVIENNESTAHQVVNIKSAGPIQFSNNIVFNNKAAGNVINATSNNSTILNCVVFNNQGSSTINAASSVLCSIINTTVVNNKGAGATNGGVAITSDKTTIYNSIIRGNTSSTGDQIGVYGDFASTVSNSALDVALAAKVIAANNLMYASTVSGFVAPSTFVGRDVAKAAELAATNWALTNEPHGMINAGDNSFFLAEYGDKDLYGAARVQHTTIDLGAIEAAVAAPALPTLTVVAGANGTVANKNGAYRMGESINLTSTPSEGFMMKDWKDAAGKVVATTKDFTFLMPATSTTLTANFDAAAQSTLTILSGDNGTASTDKSGTYNVDATVDLIATPNTDYVFAGWVDAAGAVISKEATFKYTITADATTLTAKFKYKLTRYLVSEGEEYSWERAAGLGETIINLFDLNTSLEEYMKNNKWPNPLGEGDEVWLLGDIFELYEGLVFEAEGVKWYGGFYGNETSISQRKKRDADNNGIIENWEFLYPTVLQGKFSKELMGTVLKIGKGILVDGVTITGGFQGAVDFGAGVLVGENVAGAKGATLRNSIVKGNTVSSGGSASAYSCGAVLGYNSLMEYCLVENNLIDATNTGATYGAGVAVPRSGGVLKNSVIRNNRNLGTSGVNNHGGGVKVAGGSVINCLVYNNTATRGAGIYVDNSDVPLVQYCTVANNKSESFKKGTDGVTEISFASGGGVYFRGTNGGNMNNSVIWGNTCTNETRNNIYIESDAWKFAKVVLGAIAYNGGSDDLIGDPVRYEKGYGDENTIRTLPATGVFVKPTTVVGYDASSAWAAIDWRPANQTLNVAVKLVEEGITEYDMSAFARSATTPTLGALEFGSTPSSIEKPEVLNGVNVYSTQGAIRINSEVSVSITVYNALGMPVASKATATDHVIALQSGYYIIVAKDANNATSATKVVVR